MKSFHEIVINNNNYVINPYHIPQISCDQICPQPAKNEV